MANLKVLKTRISSVGATRKITKAMQMVAAAKLRRAQESAEAARPYTERMQAVLANLSGALKDNEGAPRLMAGTGKEDTHLLLVATAERGLCGGFNSSIVKLVRAQAAQLSAAGKTVKILCVGKKGFEALKRQYGDKIIDVVDHSQIRNISFGDAEKVALKILEMYEANEFDICTLFYSEFKSVMEQVPTKQQIVPVHIEEQEETAGLGDCYEYEPEEDQILAELLPRYVGVEIFHALLENAASEQGARMSAMDSATRNAGEMIDKLTITYNRSRQAMITTELIEIISGAEAL